MDSRSFLQATGSDTTAVQKKLADRSLRVLAVAALWTVTVCNLAFGQAATVLQIDVENYAFYYGDVPDYTKFATESKAVPPAATKTFASFIGLADIVRVSGKPYKGTWAIRATHINFTPNPQPGQAMADVTRNFFVDWIWEIQQPDGTPVGTIMATGFGFGPPPPGAPLRLSPTAGSSMAITGGTGAFLGVRGQAGFSDITVQGRAASESEDPANRRSLGGGVRSFLLHLIPMTRPEILNTASGPAVVHGSDFTLVTAGKPAKAGEILSLFATGLGPTRPGVEPGQTFTADRPQVVNSPVGVLVNGKPGEVLYAGGYPGTVDGYQVNLRVPDGTASGQASLQLTSAWIAGPEVRIAIQ